MTIRKKAYLQLFTGIPALLLALVLFWYKPEQGLAIGFFFVAGVVLVSEAFLRIRIYRRRYVYDLSKSRPTKISISPDDSD